MTVHPGLSSEQQERLRTLFDEAIDLPSSRWSSFVEESAGDDPTIAAELTSLLNSYERSSGFFERLSSQAVASAIAALDEPDDEHWAAPGRTVLHYELIERIGGGGMGVVYKARDTRLDRIVALKFLPRRYDGDPLARARLLAEARAASALDNPNIGIVYEITHTEDGRPFIAMAWYDGDTLKSLIRKRRLGIDECVSIGTQLTNALEAAHASGIIHRDVKPANVIITKLGTAKLVDFGIAKLATSDDSHARAAGTVGYMSPEQTRGDAVDFRTDIWSLGVVLYEMLSGQRPFRGETDAEVVALIRSSDAPPLSAVRKDIPRSLSDMVARCLSRDPNGRFQSVAVLKAALVAEAGRPQSNSKRLPMFAGAVAATISIVAFGLWSYAGDKTPSRAAPAQATRIAVLIPPPSGASDSIHYFFDALADEIRIELARSRSVRVSSAEAAAAQEASAIPPAAIGSKLGSQFVVHGAIVGRSPGALRLSLLDTRSGTSRLDTTFDLSTARLPAAARTIALATLQKLSLPISADLRRRYTTLPTENPLAYELYLRGRAAQMQSAAHDIAGLPLMEDVRAAQAYFAQAVSLDPGFVSARARLAETHLESASRYDTTHFRREQGRLEAEAALRMDSLAVPAYEALSAYWTLNRQPDTAIAILERALQVMPDNVGLIISLGARYVSVGRWDEGTAQYDKAIRLDPGNPSANWLAASSYSRMRRQDLGMPAFTRLLEIAPQNHTIRIIRGQSWLRWKGTADTLLAAADAVPAEWDDRGMKTFARYTGLMVQRKYSEILRMLDASSSELSSDGVVYHPEEMMRAEAYRGLGDSVKARLHFDLARRQIEKSLTTSPNDPSMHSALGLVYAALGRKRDAIASAERAIQLVPIVSNNRVATAHLGLAIEMFARVGELDRAFEMIELMLTLPSGREITVPFMEVWPGFDPLRRDPRYAELIKRFPLRFPVAPK